MKISLNPDARPVKYFRYRLNSRVKDKVMKEIDKILIVCLVFPVDEVEWINHIFIQDKKDLEDIRVCVDYKSLNNACVHDLFPTPFSNEVMKNVAGNEAYSFTDGFS